MDPYKGERHVIITENILLKEGLGYGKRMRIQYGRQWQIVFEGRLKKS